MVGILNLRIYMPDRLFLEEVVSKVSMDGREGNYTILPNHVDYLSSFSKSRVRFRKQNGDEGSILLNSGVVIKCGRELQISTFEALKGEDDENPSRREKSGTAIRANCSIEKLESILENMGKKIFPKAEASGGKKKGGLLPW